MCTIENYISALVELKQKERLANNTKQTEPQMNHTNKGERLKWQKKKRKHRSEKSHRNLFEKNKKWLCVRVLCPHSIETFHTFCSTLWGKLTPKLPLSGHLGAMQVNLLSAHKPFNLFFSFFASLFVHFHHSTCTSKSLCSICAWKEYSAID